MTTEAFTSAFTNGEVGLHEGVPAPVYHRFKAPSNSLLSLMIERSAKHVAHALLNPAPSTEAKVVGEATHLAILEPDRFEGAYIVLGQCEAIKKDGKRCTNTGVQRIAGHSYCGVHIKNIAGEIDAGQPISQQNFDACRAMRDAVHAHPLAGEIVRTPGPVEVSALFKHGSLLCKARMDKPIFGANLIADVKTTEDASPRAFERSIFTYGYHRQGAFYTYAAARLGHNVERFTIIAVEKQPPHGVAVYTLKDEALAAGWKELEPALAEWEQCLKRGVWPCYPEGEQEISIPPWALRRIEADAA